ncbi:MAG: beta-propeller fold lactonase family protein [Gallionella sp.]
MLSAPLFFSQVQDSLTGLLTYIGNYNFAWRTKAAAIHPSGNWMAVTYNTVNRVRTWAINADGSLTYTGCTLVTLSSPSGIKFSPDGKCLVYLNNSGKRVDVCSFNETTGFATLVSTSTTLNLQDCQFSPDNAFLYVSGFYSYMYQFAIDTVNATIAPLSPATVACSKGNLQTMCLSPDGKSAYATAFNSGRVEHWQIDTVTGLLTWVNFYTGISTVGGVGAGVFPDGKYIHIALKIASRDLVTGVISAPFSSGSQGTPAFSPDGKHYYGGKIQWKIDEATGVPSPLSPVNWTTPLTQSKPIVLAHPSGKFVYYLGSNNSAAAGTWIEILERK